MMQSHIRQRITAEASDKFLPERQIQDDKQLRRDYERLRSANELARAVANELDLDVLLNKILEQAFALLAEGAWPHAVRTRLISSLARASGHRGMVGGQAADIAGGVTDLETLARLHSKKTGALIAWSVMAGGLVGGAEDAQLAALAT